ncbi:MAG: hypothetical protein K2G89_04285 [Lachnospiraceae bacterium]|nr:hypothetical protein [Lachnospiraceae bacterium]
MRDLSEQEIKELYESEYRNVPDVWDKVTDRIAQQEQEKKKGSAAGGTEHDKDDEKVLDFAKLGKKRWAKLLTAAAACFVIVIAYVLQNGTGMKGSTKDTPEAYPGDGVMLMPEEAQEEAGTMASGGNDESLYDVEQTNGDSMTINAETVAASDSVGEDYDRETQKNTFETSKDISTEGAWININGRLYVYDEACKASAAQLKNMKYLGESVYVADKAAVKEHLNLTGLAISGKVYESSTGEIYVLDEDSNRVYGFREE